MLTRSAARDLLPGLVRAARDGKVDGREGLLVLLSSLTGREWLQLDDVARGPGYLPGGVAGTKGWLGPASREPSGLTAVVTSMHVDGRIRERAVGLLSGHPGALQSAALALRCLDHVPQVRAAALAAIALRMSTADADAILGVLTAASARLAAPVALADYSERLLSRPDAAATLTALRNSGDRDVRRWSWEAAQDRALVTSDDVLQAAQRDTDQFVRARCCAWVGASADPAQLKILLAARPADGRVVALQHLAEQDLAADQLHDCLLARSARVRAMAQWRARRRDLDLREFYRDALMADAGNAAAALAGLSAFGTPADVSLLEPFLQDPRPAVRASAVAALGSRMPADEVRTLLPPVLLDSSPRVASAASRALDRAGASSEVTEAAWLSEQAWSRRAAWRLQRARGGWERVHADLRASNDADPGLAGTGRSGLGSWLVNGAATAWNQPTPKQKKLFQTLLPSTGLSRDARRLLAFHAGLVPEPTPAVAEPDRSVVGQPADNVATQRPRSLSLRERVRRAWGLG